MFPLKSSDAYIKENGKRSTIGAELGAGSGGGSDLPEHSIADAGKVLTVGEDGELEWDDAGGGVVILSGSTDPVNSEGEDGNIYLKTRLMPYINCNPIYVVDTTTQLLSTQSDAFYKTYDDPCIAVHYKNNNYYGPLLISPILNGVLYNKNSQPKGTVTINGLEWYVGGSEYWNNSTDSPSIPTMYTDTLPLTVENLEAIVTRILTETEFVEFDPSGKNVISNDYLKVNGNWQRLVGSLYDDVG